MNVVLTEVCVKTVVYAHIVDPISPNCGGNEASDLKCGKPPWQTGKEKGRGTPRPFPILEIFVSGRG
ncbi:hypothetical protein [Pseudooceanicola sp.]|uniref:hypothetical protein n=1 Tax=Pseudooceanicola sp. TaxID=1914328 RepID=UPI0035C709B0